MKKNEMLIKMRDQDKKIKELEHELKESKLKMEDEIILKIELETNKQLKLDVLQKLQHDILSARLKNARFDYIESSDEDEQQINKLDENIRVLNNIILQLETDISSNNSVITELKNHIKFLNAQLLI